jgi:hypothetical protein
MRTRNIVVSAMVISMFSFIGLSLAQGQEAPPQGQGQPPGQGQGRGFGRGQRGNFDPEQMRQRMMEYIKESLGAGDKEWGAIQPALEEVMNLSRDVRGGGFFGRRGGFFRPGGGPPPGQQGAGPQPQGQQPQGQQPQGQQAQGQQPPPPGEQTPPPGEQPQSEVAKAAQELRATLDKKDATPEEIKDKVTALRNAREKAKKELETSKAALREMLTPRQEAQLVLMGILD